MSYGIGLHFTHIKDSSEILNIITSIQKSERDENNIKELLEDQELWVLRKYKKCFDLGLVKNGYSRSLIFNDVLQGFFDHRFYYWPQYNLFAILYMNQKLPSYIDKYFDGFIYFQNSCDQNYDYKEWEVLGDWVKPIIEEVEKLNPEEVYKNLFDWDPDDSEDINLSHEYHKKTLVYKKIEDALDIDNALWLGNTDKFIHIMTTIPLQDDNYKISKYAIKYMEDKYKEEKEWLS